MKKILIALAVLIIAACGNKQAVAPAEGDGVSNEVAFEAKDYYAAVERYLTEQIASQYVPRLWLACKGFGSVKPM